MVFPTDPNQVYRDFVTDGVPSSGTHKPRKSDIRKMQAERDAALAAGLSNGGLVYDTRANLFADLAKGANSSAWVLSDATVANNGIYRKNGTSGAGSWSRIADLPYGFIQLNDAGAGTANAIIATSSIPLPAAASGAMLVMSVFVPNTGPVTIAANSAAPKPLKTNSGTDLAAGYLAAGMRIAFVDDGASFRLLSDVASAAIQAAAEDARDDAVEAKEAAEAAVSSIDYVTVLSRAALKATNPASHGTAYLTEGALEGVFIWRTGDFSVQVAADVDGIVYVAADSVPAIFGAWVRSDRLRKLGSYGIQPTIAGQFFQVDYASDRSDMNHYGYTANVKRTGGNKMPVGAQINSYDLSPAGAAPTTTVFGIACEAWTGDAITTPLVASGVKGLETAIIQQRHDSNLPKWGLDVVFKNRRDGATSPLYSAIGDNKYNYQAKAIAITSQGRTAVGEYCGWKTGIWFAPASLDFDAEGAAIGIDFKDAPSNRMAYAVLLGANQFIGLSGTNALDVKFRWLDSVERVQFMTGATERVGLSTKSLEEGLFVVGTKVVGRQNTGWTAATGAALKGAYAAYAGQSHTASYVQATVQALDDAARNTAQRVKAIEDALRTHGLIN